MTAAVLVVLGLAACGDSDATEVIPPVTAAAQPNRSGMQITAIDLIWPSRKGNLCALYRSVIPSGSAPNEEVDNIIVSSYEEGYGQQLTPAARAHLLQKFEECL